MKRKTYILGSGMFAMTLFVASCSKLESPPAEPPTSADAAAPVTAPAGATAAAEVDETRVVLEASVELPTGWKKEAITVGECMTPIDQINGAPATSAPYDAGSDVTFVGWNVVGAKPDATPALIYGVLKPYDQTQRGALLVGKRTPRPDVAGDNLQYANAGYEMSGKMPVEPGRYRFYVWTGTSEAISECDSKIVVTVK